MFMLPGPFSLLVQLPGSDLLLRRTNSSSQETEAAYMKILESSQTLLHVVTPDKPWKTVSGKFVVCLRV